MKYFVFVALIFSSVCLGGTSEQDEEKLKVIQSVQILADQAENLITDINRIMDNLTTPKSEVRAKLDAMKGFITDTKNQKTKLNEKFVSIIPEKKDLYSILFEKASTRLDHDLLQLEGPGSSQLSDRIKHLEIGEKLKGTEGVSVEIKH